MLQKRAIVLHTSSSKVFARCQLTLPYLTLPYLTLPYLTLPYLTLPYLTLPYLTLPFVPPARPCPLCRKKGAFVPIAFAFEPAICYSARPTHVFNPCGHVASRMVCEKWSKIPMHSSNAVTQVLRPFCPFCATWVMQIWYYSDPFVCIVFCFFFSLFDTHPDTLLAFHLTFPIIYIDMHSDVAFWSTVPVTT